MIDTLQTLLLDVPLCSPRKTSLNLRNGFPKSEPDILTDFFFAITIFI